jgi:hypothetical protein
MGLLLPLDLVHSVRGEDFPPAIAATKVVINATWVVLRDAAQSAGGGYLAERSR